MKRDRGKCACHLCRFRSLSLDFDKFLRSQMTPVTSRSRMATLSPGIKRDHSPIVSQSRIGISFRIPLDLSMSISIHPSRPNVWKAEVHCGPSPFNGTRNTACPFHPAVTRDSGWKTACDEIEGSPRRGNACRSSISARYRGRRAATIFAKAADTSASVIPLNRLASKPLRYEGIRGKSLAGPPFLHSRCGRARHGREESNLPKRKTHSRRCRPQHGSRPCRVNASPR